MVKTNILNFSMRQISESGQCFRMNQVTKNRYALVAFGRYLEVEQKGDELLLDGEHLRTAEEIHERVMEMLGL